MSVGRIFRVAFDIYEGMTPDEIHDAADEAVANLSDADEVHEVPPAWDRLEEAGYGVLEGEGWPKSHIGGRDIELPLAEMDAADVAGVPHFFADGFDELPRKAGA